MTDDANDPVAFAFEPSTDAPKKSLAISPNLEALLAHDEKARASPPKLSDLSDRHSPFVPLAFSGSVEPEFANSLPPPPRGNRRVAPRSNAPKDADNKTSLHRPRTHSDSLPNPYLNEIPKLPRLNPPAAKEGAASDESGTQQSPPTKILTLPAIQDHTSQDGIIEISSGDLPRRPSLPSSPTSDTRRSLSSTRSAERRNSTGPRPYTTIPRVDRLLGKGRDFFSSSSRIGYREELESPLNVTEFGAVLNAGVCA